MPIPATEPPRPARREKCRPANTLQPAERALVRLATAGMRAADASKAGGGTRVALAATLIELRHAADGYRAHLGVLG